MAETAVIVGVQYPLHATAWLWSVRHDGTIVFVASLLHGNAVAVSGLVRGRKTVTSVEQGSVAGAGGFRNRPERASRKALSSS